jgi:hypothetical protein
MEYRSVNLKGPWWRSPRTLTRLYPGYYDVGLEKAPSELIRHRPLTQGFAEPA